MRRPRRRPLLGKCERAEASVRAARVRLTIGVITGEQKDGEKRTRNDRIVVVQCDTHSYSAFTHIKDLGKPFVRDLEDFFVNHHRLSGKRFKVLDVEGPREARRRIDQARDTYRKD